jgi:hypothetical protein
LAFAVKISGENELLDMKCDIDCDIEAGVSPETLTKTMYY